MRTSPIFDYDPRYFLECHYLKDQLFDMQEKLLSLTDSSNLERDLFLDSPIGIEEIRFILKMAHRKGIIKKIRVNTLHDHYFYKYDYPREKMFEWEKRLEVELKDRP